MSRVFFSLAVGKRKGMSWGGNSMKVKTKGPRRWMPIMLSIVLYFALLVLISRVQSGAALGAAPVVVLGVAVSLVGLLYWTRQRQVRSQATGKAGHQMYDCDNYTDHGIPFPEKESEFSLRKQSMFRKLSCVYLIIFAVVFFAINSINVPYPIGEWDDYSLPVASLLTDGNFEISENDIAAYKELFPTWANAIDTRSLTGFFTADGEEITWYFPVYSIFCVPFVIFLHILGQPTEYAFLFANITAFMLSLLTVYRCLRVSEQKKMLLILLLSINPIVFYFSWPSAETVIYSLIVIGMVFWHNECYKQSAIAIAVAGMLNPTILSIGIVMIAQYFICFFRAKDKNTDIIPYVRKNFYKPLQYGICFIPGLIPFIYTFALTGHFYLGLAVGGYANGPELIPARFAAYLFDINYGMFPYFSAVLILGIILFPAAIVKRHGQYISLMFMFLLTVLVYSIMYHIDCGMSGIARYNAWSSVVLLFAVCIYFDEIVIKKASRKIVHISMLVGVVLSGLLLRNYGFVLAKNTPYIYMTPLAKFVLDKAPALYNPLHSTFNSRVNHIDGGYIYETPIAYIAEDGYVRKILATKDDAKELLDNFLMEGSNDWFHKEVEGLTEKESYISVPADYKLKKCVKYELNTPLLFDTEHFNVADDMITGLSFCEDWGTWTDGKEAIMDWHTDSNAEFLHGTIVYRPFDGGQNVKIYANGDLVYDMFATGAPIEFDFKNPGVNIPVHLKIELPDAVPRQLPNGDNRALSIGLQSIIFTER